MVANIAFYFANVCLNVLYSRFDFCNASF